MLYKNKAGNAYYIADTAQAALRYEMLGYSRVEDSTVKAPEISQENGTTKKEEVQKEIKKTPQKRKTAGKQGGVKNGKKN